MSAGWLNLVGAALIFTCGNWLSIIKVKSNSRVNGVML
jgi:hypothetical protein